MDEGEDGADIEEMVRSCAEEKQKRGEAPLGYGEWKLSAQFFAGVLQGAHIEAFVCLRGEHDRHLRRDVVGCV